MKTIELSYHESEEWDRDPHRRGYRLELIERERRRAERLGVTVEVFHRTRVRLLTIHPAGGAQRTN